jgi:AcrR family transcriptional regulator
MNKTKLHILQVAFKLFLQKSFKEVTMSEIVTKTGMSKGAFYHHFKSKEQLFIEVIEKFCLSDPLVSYKPVRSDSLSIFFHDYIDNMLAFQQVMKASMDAADPDSELNYISLGFDSLKRYPGFREKIRNINAEIKKIWINLISTARYQGEIESLLTDDEIACHFMYLSDGIGIHLTLEGRPEEIALETLRLWEGFYNEIKKS